MNRKRYRHLAAAVLLVSAVAVSTSASAETPPKGRTLWVSTIGVDSHACGPTDSPCRTITRALTNAAEGDTVVVEPGEYGDVNRDGDQDDAGEEQTTRGAPCAVCIRKRVNLYSSHGATVTGITHLPNHIVTIFADGTNFGARDKGFTLHGLFGGSLTVELAGNVRVVGNVARSGQVGYFVMAERGPVQLRDNIAMNNNVGGILATTSRNGGPGYAILKNNTVMDAGMIGISLDGFVPHIAINNSLARNGRTGFEVRNNSWVADNAITDSNGAGVLVEGTGEAIPGTVLGGGVKLYRNVIIGNGRAGIEFLRSSSAPNHQIHFNTIFGNGVDSMSNPDDPAPANCGLLNLSGGFIDATKNYWGSSSGPGSDPADEAGEGLCEVSGNTLVEPYRTAPR